MGNIPGYYKSNIEKFVILLQGISDEIGEELLHFTIVHAINILYQSIRI